MYTAFLTWNSVGTLLPTFLLLEDSSGGKLINMSSWSKHSTQSQEKENCYFQAEGLASNKDNYFNSDTKPMVSTPMGAIPSQVFTVGQCVLGFESYTKIIGLIKRHPLLGQEPSGSGHFTCTAGLRYRGFRMASHTLTSSSNNAFSLWRTLQIVRKLHVSSLGIKYQLRYVKASIHWRKGSNGNLSARTFPVQSELQLRLERSQ